MGGEDSVNVKYFCMTLTPSIRQIKLAYISRLLDEIELIKRIPAQNGQVQQEVLIELNNQLGKQLKMYQEEIKKL